MVPMEKLPVWVFAICKSIVATLVAFADDLSVPVGLASPGSETVAVLVTLGAAVDATLTVNVMLGNDPAAAIGPGFVQTTVWTVEVGQVQVLPLADKKDKPVGSVSVTVIAPVVAAPPAFETAMVYVPFCPTLKFPVWVFEIDTSGATPVPASVMV